MKKTPPKSIRVVLPDEIQNLIAQYQEAEIENKRPVSELARQGIILGIGEALGLEIPADIAVMSKANNPHGLGGHTGKTRVDVK